MSTTVNSNAGASASASTSTRGSDGRVFSYYPGCSQMAMNRAYDVSTRSVAARLGLELVELEDWNCCGATAYVAIREEQAFVLSARNLALAEQAGRPLVTACSGCFVVLNKANKYMAEDPELRSDITRALAAGSMRYRGTVAVRHFLDVVVNDVGEETVRAQVTRPLPGLKVAAYHGCQFSRPFGERADPEFPDTMDRLVNWLGGETVPFALKAKCCGGLMMTTQPDVGRALTGKILKAAKEAGADCVITCCPLCQFNLEGFQRRVGAAVGCDCALPVLYFTQLMGHAFGLDARALALGDSLTPVAELLHREAVHS
ncbi:MAG TPA: CoB--CoM heterodisulfide reductase iron-sulfur subunit B family protein [Candidatus Hydrogenedentes bacterium]|nr:CoB--CoM heterodisulfide reductase iron-sulfur subunit B family protein [Candidatus Hydrogenedentota bacterium]